MGIIVRQSVKGTVYTYIGAAIGFINTAIMFPLFFSTKQIGLIFLLISVAVIFGSFFSLGFSNVTLRLFPYFNDKEKKHNGFSFLMFAVICMGILLFLISFFLLKEKIIEQNTNSPEFVSHIFLIIPLVIFEILFRILNSYSSVLLNTVIGTFYKEFILRILISGLILLFFLNRINYEWFVRMYVFIQIVPPLAIFIYLFKEKQFSLKPDFSFLKRDLKYAIFFTAVVGLITGLTASGYQYIDKYMINTMLNLSDTGIYTIAFFFGSVISMPTRSLKKIAAVIIAKAWKNNNIKEINIIYKKSSITQSIIGLFVLIGILININDLVLLLGKEYSESRIVILFVGLSFLTELTFGLSYAIIANSKYFHFLLYFMILFFIMVIITNYVFIPLYGIRGAAFASFLSMLFFSFTKYLFILKKFKIQPFVQTHIYIFLCSSVILAGFYFLPGFTENSLYNIIIKSILYVSVYVFLVYKLKFSEDINIQINKLLNLIKI